MDRKLALSFAKRMVVLTGTGVSAESGINPFRGQRLVADVTTTEAYRCNSAKVWCSS